MEIMAEDWVRLESGMRLQIGVLRYKTSVKHYNEMVCRQLKYPCSSEKEKYSWSLYTLFESYRGLSALIGMPRVCVNSSFF